MVVSAALASALLAGAAPAYADGAEILTPGDGEVLTSSRPVTVSAKTDWYQVSMSLYVESPSGSRQKIASGGANQTISGSFDPGDAPNGTFTVSLFGEVTHKTYATSTFVLSRPPEAPSGVRAELEGLSTIRVSWAKGAEPDLQSYEITSVKAGKSGSVSVDSACSGSTCQASLALPAGLGGQKVDVSVRAFRSDGAGGTVGSERSAAPDVSVPAPKASPSPSPKPSKTDQAAQPPVAKTPDTHRPSAEPEPALPEDTQLTEDPELGGNTELTLPEAGGDDQTEPVVVPEETDDPKTTAQSSFLPLGGLNFGVYIALAVVLLLTGANLGAWLRRKGLTGDTAGNGQTGGSQSRPATGETDASPEAAPVAGGAVGGVAGGTVALGGPATAKARGATPVRRPSIILARPKAREDLPETVIGAGAGPGGDAPTAATMPATATMPAATSVPAATSMPAATSVPATTGSGREITLSHQEPIGTGQAVPAHTSPSTAGQSDRGPVASVPVASTGAAVNARMPDPPLRQPEPDVWTEDDDSLHPGRHRDL